MTSFYGEHRERNIIIDEEENKISRANIDKWIVRLLVTLIVLVPLIILGSINNVVSPLISDISILTSGYKGSLFSYYKSITVLIITIIVLILFLLKILFMNGTIIKTKFNIFLGIFAGVIVISTIVSPTITIALNGHYERSDGAIMWLCYIALIFIAMNIDYPKNIVRYVKYAFIPFVFINLYIIAMNFIGNDLLKNEPVQKLLSIFIPEGIVLTEGSSLIGTLSHGNYMSGMFAILTMMYLAGVIIEKNLYLKFLNSILSMLTILILLMSLSTSGFLTILCVSPLLLWLFLKSDKKIVTFILLTVLLVFSVLSLHILAQMNSKVWDETFGFFTSSNPYVEENITSFVERKYDYDEFILGHKVSAADSTFELPVLPESGVGAGSGRIYIWEKTLKLVVDRPFFGYGLDTLMYNFPHYNIDARANLETENVVVDKPHNMYVGVLYGTGIFGLISFMGIILITLFFSLKSIIKYNRSNSNIVVLSVAWIVFLIQALFNDTLAGVAGPLFIVIGILIRKMNINKNTKFN